MGMYDTINGEQVKCFPWISHQRDDVSHTQLWSHGGSLKTMKTGDPVPYRAFNYNYGKNFNIYDCHPAMVESEKGFVIHAIRDGHLQTSVWYDVEFATASCKLTEITEILQSAHTIGYMGEHFINIHSFDEALAFYHASHKLIDDINNIRTESNQIFKDWSRAIRELRIAKNNEDPTSKNTIKAKIDSLHISLDTAHAKENPLIEKVKSEFQEKWITPDSKENQKFELFGEWMAASLIIINNIRGNSEVHEFDEYIEDFKTFINESFKQIDDDFIQSYMNLCEATDNDRIVINEIYKSLC